MRLYAEELVKRGHQVTVVTAKAVNAKPARLPSWETIQGVEVRRIALLPPHIAHLYFAPGIYSALARLHADVMNVFTLLPSFMLSSASIMARLRHIPLVLHPYLYPHRFDTFANPWKRWLGKAFDATGGKAMLRLGNHIVALTPEEADLYRKMGLKRVTLVYEPAILPLSPTGDQVASFRQRWNLNGEGPILLTVGRLEPRKGQDFLIHALPSILSRHPGARLLLVGADMGMRRKLEALAVSQGCAQQIVFTGQLSPDDLEVAFALADIVVVPSAFEAWGRIVVEGWLHRKPVVASDGAAIAKLMTQDKGLVVAYEDTAALSSAVISLLDDPEMAQRLAEGGARLAQEMTVEKAVDKLEAIYTELYKRRLERSKGRSLADK